MKPPTLPAVTRLTAAAMTVLGACAGPHESEAVPSKSPPLTARAADARAADARAEDERAIRAVIAGYRAAANARDVPAVMRSYAPTNDLVVFDVVGQPAFRGTTEVTRDWQQFVDAMREITLDFRDVTVTVDPGGELAYATFIERSSLTPKGGKPLVDDELRTTQIYRKIDGRWLIVHEHKSQARQMTGSGAA